MLTRDMLNMRFVIVLMAGFVACSMAHAQSGDAVLWALSARHMNTSVEELEQLAGGPDAFVARLLELRTKETPPQVGIRAEKILLRYSAREDVQRALEDDVQSPQYKGLARVIAVNIDDVVDTSVRRRLAGHALKRGAEDSSFSPYSRSLLNSKDDGISRMAREAFPSQE